MLPRWTMAVLDAADGTVTMVVVVANNALAAARAANFRFREDNPGRQVAHIAIAGIY